MYKQKLIFLILLYSTASLLYSQTLGDVNNDAAIDIVDALLVAQYYVGLNPPALTNLQGADVNCDNSTDIVDSLLIAQYYVGLSGEFECAPTPSPQTTIGIFTWAVIVDLDSEPVTREEAQELVDQSSDILMELTHFSYIMVDFVQSTRTGTVSDLAGKYIQDHPTSVPNGIIIFSYGDNDQARTYGGYSFTLKGPPDFKNTFNSPVVGNSRVYISVQHWSHRYARCGYESSTAEEPVQDTSFGGECRNQDGIPCVERYGYFMCANAVNDLYASSRTYFGSSVIIHETMHPFGYEGNLDHYRTDKCNAHMIEEASDRPYNPASTDLTEFQYYNGICPYVYDNFVNSYQP